MGRAALKKQITADDIFRFTDNGRDVFEREIVNFTLTKNILSPFRSEKNPSFRIKQSSTSGLYIGVDYTTGEVYTAIGLVQELYNLDFREAIEKIAWDFRISDMKKEAVKVVIKSEKEVKPLEPLLYEFTEMKFEQRHHDYWNCGQLTEEFLRENNVFAASHIAINRKVIEIPKDEMCFVYVPSDLPYGNLKVLRIGDSVDKSQKWRTNIPNDYLWNFSKIKEPVDTLWVIKSIKDELIAKMLGLNTISVQSENKQILDKNMERSSIMLWF